MKLKITAKIVGILFLTAMAASLIGGGLIESTLNDFSLKNISENNNQISVGILLECINAIAVVGIAVLMFPIIKEYNNSLAIGYVGFRIIESVFCFAAAVIPLSILEFAHNYLNVNSLSSQNPEVIFITMRNSITGLLIPISFSLGALLFYYFLYRTKMLPRFVAVWGFAGVILILILNILTVEINIGIFLALPIILNEIFLGIWLTVKGFNKPSASV